ncbi:hypothetical protein HMPREF3196_02031 [Bifidobacterium bifidum]|uniref:Uncharacterized protein n=1 Tax=Bifidobacterium bifidum TaxID=1681 RepID=A0A133KK61_BIFBI|nr:hypothetical protein HMPREF3196_02031 [Bifidobacterium bifidum]
MAYIVVCVNDVRDGIDGGRRYAAAPIFARNGCDGTACGADRGPV